MNSIIKISHLTIVSSLFLAVLFLLPGQGWSQQETAGEARHIEITDDQITAFTKAHIKVEKINQDYQRQLATVTSAEEQQKIVEEANEKMIAVIQTSGLSVEIYNAIVQQIPNDAALKNRIAQEIQRLQTA